MRESEEQRERGYSFLSPREDNIGDLLQSLRYDDNIFLHLQNVIVQLAARITELERHVPVRTKSGH